MNYSKKDIVKEAQVISKMKPNKIQPIVDLVFDSITAKLLDGDSVKISGFGNFTVKTKAPRRHYDINSGENIYSKEKKVVVFTPCKTLNDGLQDED